MPPFSVAEAVPQAAKAAAASKARRAGAAARRPAKDRVIEVLEGGL
jgi:hypothetical protein